MAEIKCHAGDFQYVWLDEAVFSGEDSLRVATGGSGFWGLKGIQREKIPISQLAVVDVATEETVKKMGGTIGWGVAGGVILGPVGLLAGLLLGGKKKEITFVAKFKDGRKFLATTDSETFKKLKAAAF